MFVLVCLKSLKWMNLAVISADFKVTYVRIFPIKNSTNTLLLWISPFNQPSKPRGEDLANLLSEMTENELNRIRNNISELNSSLFRILSSEINRNLYWLHVLTPNPTASTHRTAG